MRILFLTSRPPWPGRRGDQVRAARWIEQLRHRHEVSVVAQCWPGFVAQPPPSGVELESVWVGWPGLLSAAAKAGIGAATGLDPRPLQVGLFDQPAFRRAVRQRVARQRPDVVVMLLSRLATVLEDLPGTPVVVDLVDDLALNMEQRARRQPALAWLWRAESRRMRAWDRQVIAASAASVVVAERDCRAESPESPNSPNSRRLQVMPFGLELPAGLPTARTASEAACQTVVLTGNLGYFPTVDGAQWFARHVWPEVLRQRPSATWLLAGARPARAVRRLARLPGVRLLANPPDLGKILDSATVSVAPLRSGSGTPIKILEAMAHGVPVVSTTAGAEGLDELPTTALSIADPPAAFASAVSALLRQPEQAQEQTRSAFAWLQQRHDITVVALRFEELLEQLAAKAE